jgi:hypothetical protein
MRVVLGNRDALHSKDNGETFERMSKGKRATSVEFPEGTSLREALQIVTGPQGVWPHHAAEGATPAWVASDNSALAELLSSEFGGVEVRELEEPSSGGSGVGAKLAPLLGLMLALVSMLAALQRVLLLLKTNACNDFQAAQMGGAASATAVAKFVGLTANTTAPAAGDTTLTAEITTAGGGLIRKAGTYAHTTGAANYTITTVFTANGSDSLPVTIGKRGIFDAVTGGNLVFETLVSPTATLSASGDQLTLTDTISL